MSMYVRSMAVAVLVLVAGCGKPGDTGPAGNALLVYVPCGMELPFTNAETIYSEANPDTPIQVVLDNANVLVRRVLEKGEKPDLIVSPGMVEMEKLVEAGALAREDIHPFAQYELVLFTPRANPAGVEAIADLKDDKVSVIAIADPDENSVGRYTREALTSMGLWDEVKGKMVFTDHPITAYKDVAREKAQASFAYRSCPLKTAPEKLAYSKVRIIESVPADSYGPAYAGIAVLSASPRREAAETFIAYMLSPEGQELLRTYDVPPLRDKPAASE
jgi:molybdate transport system substrate-binding protein